MTFYNYELINRGSLTLFNTYFGFFTDGALGDPFDDYVGCDVNRGLAYYYNGNNFDADNAGFKGYGDSPPAIGVDFFEMVPFQDDDGIDNAFGIGEGEALNGIGYGDGIVDNERFECVVSCIIPIQPMGQILVKPTQSILQIITIICVEFGKMGVRFIMEDPVTYPTQMQTATQHVISCFRVTQIRLDGEPTEFLKTVGLRSIQEMFQTTEGFFNRLDLSFNPGAVNNITVGVVYARAKDGNPFSSVEVLRRADDKAQSLFENCFKIIDAPHAPDLSAQELENELILFLNNPLTSNNYQESYVERDPFIVTEDSLADKNYRFQGYQIFQLKDNTVDLEIYWIRTKPVWLLNVILKTALIA